MDSLAVPLFQEPPLDDFSILKLFGQLGYEDMLKDLTAYHQLFAVQICRSSLDLPVFAGAVAARHAQGACAQESC